MGVHRTVRRRQRVVHTFASAERVGSICNVDMHGGAIPAERSGLYVGDQFFRLLVSRILIRMREDDAKFVTTQTTDDIRIAEISGENIRHVHQCIVTGAMPVRILDLFEIVDIEIEDARGFAIPFGKRHGPV